MGDFVSRLYELLPDGLSGGQRSLVGLLVCAVLYGLLITRSER